ncbi:MAG: hypothetical protein AB4372_04940 [Xenococcus sp. (in: cyanobacteria)]
MSHFSQAIRTYRIVATLQQRYVNVQQCQTVEEMCSVLEDHSQEYEFVVARKPSQGVIEQFLKKQGHDLDNNDLVGWYWYEINPSPANYDEF